MPRAQSYRQKENFFNTSKKPLKNRNETFPVVRYFSWKLELVSNTLWVIVCANSFFAFSSLQTPLNLIFLTILIILSLFTKF